MALPPSLPGVAFFLILLLLFFRISLAGSALLALLVGGRLRGLPRAGDATERRAQLPGRGSRHRALEPGHRHVPGPRIRHRPPMPHGKHAPFCVPQRGARPNFGLPKSQKGDASFTKKGNPQT